MATLREILTRFSFQADGTSLDKIKGDVAAVKTQLGEATKAVDGFRAQAAGAFGALRTALAGYLTLATGNALTFGFADEAKRLGDLSQTLGMATEDVQTWQYALKGAGMEADAAAAAMTKIQKSASEAAAGGGEAAATFTKLGLAASDLKGMPMGTLLPRLLDSFQKLPDAGARTAAAIKLFGEQGAKLVPFLMKGAAGADALKAKLAQAGVIMSASTIETARKASEAQKDLAMQLTGVKNTIAAALLPEVARITAAVAKWLRESVGLKRIVEIVRGIGTALLVAIGYVAIAKIGMFVAAIGRAVAALRAMGIAAAFANGALLLVPLAILAIIGMIDDLYHFWKGDRQTLVGKLLGEDGQKRLRNWITEFVNLGETIQNSRAAEIFGTAWEAAGDIVDGVQSSIAWLWETAEEAWEWFSTPPKEGEGFLGVIHALAHGVYLVLEKLFQAGKKVKEFFLGEDLETAQSFGVDAENAAGMATGELRRPQIEREQKALALGLPVEYGSETSYSRQADVIRAENLSAAARYDPAAAAALSKLQSEASRNVMADALGDPAADIAKQIAAGGSQTFAPVTTVNVQARTDADPAAIAREVESGLTGLFKSTYANYKRSGAGG